MSDNSLGNINKSVAMVAFDGSLVYQWTNPDGTTGWVGEDVTVTGDSIIRGTVFGDAIIDNSEVTRDGVVWDSHIRDSEIAGTVGGNCLIGASVIAENSYIADGSCVVESYVHGNIINSRVDNCILGNGSKTEGRDKAGNGQPTVGLVETLFTDQTIKAGTYIDNTLVKPAALPALEPGQPAEPAKAKPKARRKASEPAPAAEPKPVGTTPPASKPAGKPRTTKAKTGSLSDAFAGGELRFEPIS